MKNKLIASLLLLCMLACLVLSGCSGSALSVKEVEKDPAAYLQKGLESWGTQESALVQLLRNVMTKGTVELNLDVADIQLQNTLAIDNGAFSDKLSGTVSGEPMDLSADYGNRELAVSSSLLSDNGEAYGLNLDALLEQGTDSNLAQLLGLDQDFFDSISSVISSDGSLTDLFADYQTIFKDVWQQELGTAVVGEQKITLDGQELDTVTVTTTATADQVNAYMKKLLEPLKTPLEDESGESFSQLMDIMKVTNLDGSSVWYLDKKTGALAKYTMDLSETVSDMSITIKTECTADLFDVSMNATRGTETLAMRLSGNTKTEQSVCISTLEAKLEVPGASAATINGTLTNDTKDGAFTLELSGSAQGEDINAVITGTAKLEQNAAQLSVDSVKVGDVTMDTKISLKLTAGTAAVEKPAYSDLLTLDDDTLTDLFYRVILGSAYTNGLNGDDDYPDVPDGPVDDTLCELCQAEAHTQTVEYLGMEWNVCDSCAEALSADFCDICGTEASDLTVVELEDFSVRMCDDCLAQYAIAE